MAKNKKPNRLIQESSPYLLQHAHNPVDWYPWGDEALQKAKQEDKPILVSIGYAACHWCHVMEHQSFENDKIAKVMNEHFVCIKVDREERPDVDAVHMDALQAMGVQGGWPLNVFLNSDAKPFYGGTYFSPQQWVTLLLNIAEAYQKNRQELDQSAEQFVQHLNQSELTRYGLHESEASVSEHEFEQLYQNLAKQFDKKHGGLGRAPKFPMPTNYLFLLRYYHHVGDETALKHLNLTLHEMAYGGIYDQIGGGFARYSVDEKWLVPHFEKMLYDNGQLVSLYAEAYLLTKDPLYKDVAYETIAFVERELMSEEGGFYSSLDADSEGVEGKFYVFTREELQDLVGEEEPIMTKYYHATTTGNFEHGQNILHRRISDEHFAKENELELEVLEEMVKTWKEKLMEARAKRIRPGLDDKILCSWNALMLKGLADAYYTFGNKHFLHLATRNAEFMLQRFKKGDRLYHNYKKGTASIEGFLEDYALFIRALIRVYEITFDEKYLQEARQLVHYTLANFFDEQEKLFFFTDQNAQRLVARTKELLDNVIPSSNSVMATNLYLLGLYFNEERFQQLSDAMLAQVKPLVVKEPSHMSNWACLYFHKLEPTAEVAIVGQSAPEMRSELSSFYIPNMLLAGTDKQSTLPLLQDRSAVNGKTTVYVCYNKACQLPVHTAGEALEQLQKGLKKDPKFPAL
ncbi:thioredoxin domain-containing protein [Pontibacter sp. JH31]|uniref:Thioredoxin domain-containing protein n=1 Tax=Pontibacter aquaedesilientis TaxID=2766980 RepID=A0ABR7XHQ6_9BACT|nr:thioredoxin domain-containing protein [Pontibacter aquaedesilientis]MBD1397834.1 thioredoxin domain-containing protein [Pontibacter aquaedesilientis]